MLKMPIDEKKLDKLASDYELSMGSWEYCAAEIEEAYKEGYRKAKMEE